MASSLSNLVENLEKKLIELNARIAIAFSNTKVSITMY